MTQDSPHPQPDTSDFIPVRQPDPETNLHVWTSPSRIYHKHSKDFYTSIGTIIFLVCVILLFLKQIALILAIISFGFFVYVIDNIKPEKVSHRITNYGISTLEKMFFWDQLGRFWFAEEYGKYVLYIENFLGFPPRLFMLIEEKDKDELEEILKKYLVMQKPEPTQVEKWSQWLSDRIVLESPKKPSSNPPTSSHSSAK